MKRERGRQRERETDLERAKYKEREGGLKRARERGDCETSEA